MVNQVESFCRCFPDLKPGWVYDKENKKMVDHGAAPSTICSTDIEPLVALREISLRNLIETENKKEYVWSEEFQNSTEKHSFVLSFTGVYIDKLDSLESVTEGTVTEVKYQKCLKMLICSTEESSFDECFEYLEKVLEGKEAELSSKICESCKKCFIFNFYSARGREIQDFTSIMSCFKEVTRIIDEMKSCENFELFSFKYVSQIGSNDLQLCSSSEDWNANISDDSKIIPDNLCPEGSKNSCQGFNKCSNFTTRESEKYNFNHSEEAAARKVNSFKKRTKIDKNNSIAQSIKISATKRSSQSESNLPQKKISEDLKSKIDPKNSIKVKEHLIKSQYKKSDQFQNFGSENSIFQKVEGTEVLMAVSESISNDYKMSNLENGLIEVYPSSLSRGFPYSNENSKFALNTQEPLSCFTDHIYSDGVSSLEIDPRQTGTLMNRKISINSEIPLLHSFSKEDEQLKSFTDESFGNIKLSEDPKVEKNCDYSLFENEVGLKDDNHDVCVNDDQLGPELRNGISHLEKLDPCNIQKQTIYYGERIIMLTITDLNGIRRLEIGNRMREGKGKVIILLGATGSGKTSLVNLCANFYFGAKNADEEKLFVVDPKTKTGRVTVYTFYPEEEGQIPLTVVDTPGLNDSTGAEIHDHVDALKSFLALACSQGLEINALAFVAQAHLVRLTSSEKLVMDYVRSLFGAEVEKHIMALVTFSDNQPTPPVIEAMEQYGFKSPFFLKFNNTLLISKTEAVDDLDRIYWRTGMRSWKKCLKQLNVVDSLSNVAISSIKKEVFNMSVLNKYKSSLEAEFRNFITMCRKKKEIQEFYSDRELHFARKKVWMASNDAYNVNMFAETKEIFLINSCQLQLENESIPDLSAFIKLFLLLDNESTLRCVLKKLVALLVQCLNIFHNHNYFQTLLFTDKLFSLTANSIKKEISKYDDMNSGVGSLWTVEQVLLCLQFDDPDEYDNKRINEIFESLNRFSQP